MFRFQAIWPIGVQAMADNQWMTGLRSATEDEAAEHAPIPYCRDIGLLAGSLKSIHRACGIWLFPGRFNDCFPALMGFSPGSRGRRLEVGGPVSVPGGDCTGHFGFQMPVYAG